MTAKDERRPLTRKQAWKNTKLDILSSVLQQKVSYENVIYIEFRFVILNFLNLPVRVEFDFCAKACCCMAAKKGSPN
jgi:hypothetical protein